MKFRFDQDYHIHSQISLCSSDPEQTTGRILRYAQECGLRQICLTDHFWDETVSGAENFGFYRTQNYDWISRAKPLPQAEGIEFLFGCETDLDRNLTLGIAPEHFDRFDFVIIPTTHLHMNGFTISPEDGATAEGRACQWIKRLDAVLNMPLPFHKIGIAHLTCGLIAPKSREEYLSVLNLLPTEELERLFAKAAAVGVGIELNADDMKFSDGEADTVLRLYRIAKNYGCRFYCGSDAHHPGTFGPVREIFQRAIDLLGLQESDKFHIEKFAYRPDSANR